MYIKIVPKWRSYCSTWTALHRSQQQHKHAIKINTSEIHPAKSITDFHWTTHSTKLKLPTAPFYNKTAAYRSNQTQHIAAPETPNYLPWHNKPCEADTGLTRLRKNNKSPVMLKTFAIGNIHTTTALYTSTLTLPKRLAVSLQRFTSHNTR